MNLLGMVEIMPLRRARKRDRELAETRAELAAIATERDAVHAELATLAAERDAARAELATRSVAPTDSSPLLSEPASSDGAGDRPHPAVPALIAVADRLFDVTGGASPNDPDQAAAALRWISEQVQALLQLCDVTMIVDTGELNFLRHEIVADRDAPSPGLVDHIAETVRPGYRWRDDLLRAQQVVVYTD